MTTPSWRSPALVIVCGGLILSLALGMRHSFGLFLQPMSFDQGWGRETFAFAIALQNLLWGVAQPFTGMVADRFGAGRVVVFGALAYVAGLVLMPLSDSGVMLSLSAGLLVGLGLSGTGFSIIYGAIGRAVPPHRRTAALGTAGALGSLGQFAMLPVAQSLISSAGWAEALWVLAAAVAATLLLAVAMAEPSARPNPTATPPQGLGSALAEAFSHRGFWLLGLGFLACGFQLAFIGNHLPAFLLDQGLNANVGMRALALVGLFNVLGTWAWGQMGGRWRAKNLLSILYLLRAGLTAAYMVLPVSATTTYVFAAGMGFLWLGTAPLTSAVLSQIFGVRYISTLFGFVFFSHQVGSFLGVWLGGLVFDATGSYDVVWTLSIGLGVLAALLHYPIDDRSPAPVPAGRAA
ncbi:MFS transporter [Denitromonas iodatirespirans]|uniref:MFS transporter n=1 Tax=Denitromonas iodatirespirans TaxID=2795389 RepID=A0A944HFV4_DENI1|nr:MFS transporter [Denitromonas iodatirespirans]MBT0964046.1 MFS transporter [Denitromonas iodatirespirans]